MSISGVDFEDLAADASGGVLRSDPQRTTVLTVELFEGNAVGPRIARTELEFSERDANAERWASAGVVVAALVTAQSVGVAAPSATSVPAQPVRAARPLPHASGPRGKRSYVRVDLGASGGSEPELAWLSGSLGVGARVGIVPPRWSIEVRTEAVAESLWITGRQCTSIERARQFISAARYDFL